MKECGHDKWKGFYDNDCQTDIKRNGIPTQAVNGVYQKYWRWSILFYQWQRLIIYPERDRKIMLLLNYENHLTDGELYQAMKEKENNKFDKISL